MGEMSGRSVAEEEEEEYDVAKNFFQEELDRENIYKVMENQAARQVRVKFIEVNWLTKDGVEDGSFVQALTERADVSIFFNKTVQEIVNYMWNECRTFFQWNLFPKFLFGCLIPICTI